jgi:nucleoside-diphosphate-sugar epimerase
MKKVLVTGATGFIGTYVINELLTRQYQVVATSLSAGKAAAKDWYARVTYIPFDLGHMQEQTDYYAFFGRPDLAIHLAWEGLPNYKSDFHITENLPRHFSFCRNLVSNGLNDLTVTGSCFEYGMQEGALSENMPSLPGNQYAIAKDRLRMMLQKLSASQPFSLKWVRLFYMYGRGQSPNSLLSQLQSALDRGDTVFNMSPGDQLRDYMPVEEVARTIVRVALQDKVTGVINCASGKPMQVKDLVKQYLDKEHKQIELNLGYYPYSDIEPKNFWGDTAKLKTIIGNE